MRLSRLFTMAAALLLTLAPAQADMIATGEIQRQQAASPAIEAASQRPRLRRQLIAEGLSPELADERLTAMTDAQVIALEGKLAEMPAGAAVGTTNLLLIIIILILLI